MIHGAIKLCQIGSIGSAVDALVGGEVAPSSLCTLRKLRALQFTPHATSVPALRDLRARLATICADHYAASACLHPGPLLDDDGHDTSDGPRIVAALRAAKRGSAAGPDGSRLDSLAALGLSGDVKAIRGYVLFVCHVANGGLIVDGTHSLFSGATATALLKGGNKPMPAPREPNPLTPYRPDEEPLKLALVAAAAVEHPDPRAIRPLGVGGAVRRNALACILAKFTDPRNNIIANHLRPYQFSIGLPNGCEIMFNTVRQYLTADPGAICLGSDIGSAFQVMPRAHVLAQILAHPALHPLLGAFATCYASPSPIYYNSGRQTGYSEEGFQQGCPFGSLGWCIGFHQVLSAVHAAHPGVLILCFADDLWLLGKPPLVLAAYTTTKDLLLQLRVHEKSLDFAPGKQWLWSAGPTTLDDLPDTGTGAFPADFKRVPAATGFQGLGCFASTNAAWLECEADDFFTKRHTELHAALRAMCDFAHVGSDFPEALHCAHLCATYSASTRLSAFIRQMPVRAGFKAVQGHQARMLDTLNATLGGDPLWLRTVNNLSGDQRLAQASNEHTDNSLLRQRVQLARRTGALPVAMHGMGYQAPHITHPCAAIASWAATLRHAARDGAMDPVAVAAFAGPITTSTLQTYVELREAWAQLADLCDGEAPLLQALRIASLDDLPTSPVHDVQAALTAMAFKHHSAELVAFAASISDGDRRRLISCAGRGGGAAFTAIPNSPLTTLNNFDFRCAAYIRLGLKLPCLDNDHTPCAHGCVRQALAEEVRSPDTRTFADPHWTGGPRAPPRRQVTRTIPDPYGNHSLGCNYSNVNWTRHQRLRDALLACLHRAGIRALPSNLDLTHELRDQLGLQQADIVLPNLYGFSRSVHIDVTVTHPLLLTSLGHNYTEAGDAVHFARAALKGAQYGVLNDFGNRFVTFGAESYGSFDPRALAWFEDHVVNTYLDRHGLHPRSRQGQQLADRFRSDSLQAMAVAIQKGNASGIRRLVQLRHPTDASSFLALMCHPAPARPHRPPLRGAAASGTRYKSPPPLVGLLQLPAVKHMLMDALRAELSANGCGTAGLASELRARLRLDRERRIKLLPGFPLLPGGPTTSASHEASVAAAAHDGHHDLLGLDRAKVYSPKRHCGTAALAQAAPRPAAPLHSPKRPDARPTSPPLRHPPGGTTGRFPPGPPAAWAAARQSSTEVGSGPPVAPHAYWEPPPSWYNQYGIYIDQDYLRPPPTHTLGPRIAAFGPPPPPQPRDGPSPPEAWAGGWMAPTSAGTRIGVGAGAGAGAGVGAGAGAGAPVASSFRANFAARRAALQTERDAGGRGQAGAPLTDVQLKAAAPTSAGTRTGAGAGAGAGAGVGAGADAGAPAASSSRANLATRQAALQAERDADGRHPPAGSPPHGPRPVARRAHAAHHGGSPPSSGPPPRPAHAPDPWGHLLPAPEWPWQPPPPQPCRRPVPAALPDGPQRPGVRSPPTPRPRPTTASAADGGPAAAITATLAWEQPIHGADPPGAARALPYCADATAEALAGHLSCPYGCTEQHRHFACITIRITTSEQVGRGPDRLAALGLCAGGSVTALCVPWP